MKASASVWARAGENEGGGAGAGELARLGSLDGQREGLGRARGSGNASKVSGQKVKSLSSPASRESGQSFCVVQRPGQCWQDIKVSRPATGRCLSPSGALLYLPQPCSHGGASGWSSCRGGGASEDGVDLPCVQAPHSCPSPQLDQNPLPAHPSEPQGGPFAA